MMLSEMSTFLRNSELFELCYVQLLEVDHVLPFPVALSVEQLRVLG